MATTSTAPGIPAARRLSGYPGGGRLSSCGRSVPATHYDGQFNARASCDRALFTSGR